MPRTPRVSLCLSLPLLALFLVTLLPAPSVAEALDMSKVYRSGEPRDGMLIADRISVLFEAGAKPELVAKNGAFLTDQPMWNSLAQSFDIEKMNPIFRNAASKSKWSTPEEEEMSRWYTVRFDGDKHDLADIALALETMAGVEQVAAIPIGTYDAVVPDDPNFDDQVWLHNLSIGGRDIRAMAGWYYETGDPNVVVAVADSGVDWMHPDLGGTGPDYLDGSIWINDAEWNGTPGVDDDGNGYTDDIRGWDFVDGVAGEQNPPQDVSIEDNDPMDYDGHGTAVAGCVAAIGNNGTGVIGVAFTSKVMALKVGWLQPGASLGVIGMDFAASAMNYARVNGAQVYNASWGSSAYPPLVTAVNNAVFAGMTIVTAAGNDGDQNPSYLGARTDVITVAATTSGDSKASFSDFGTWIDVSAPGSSIYTTQFNVSASGSAQHTYGGISGTSFSSPITAGMAALVRSANPSFTRAEVHAAIVAATDFIDDVNSPDLAGKLGSGRINILKLYDDTRIEIPEQMDTITGAVSTLSLEPGSEIAVLGGHTIVEDWTLVLNHDYQVLGGWDPTYTTRDPVGNPSTLQAASNKPALRVRSGVGPATVIDGFRITGGTAETVTASPVTGDYGGGARIQNSDVTLRNLILEGNAAGNATDISGGGGMAILSCSPTLENVEITGNTGLRGAGLYIFNGNPQIDGLNVHDNVSHAGPFNTPPQGGGIYIVDSPSAKVAGTVTISNSIVSGHTVAGSGGGIYVSNSDLVLDTVEINGNTATLGGGGIHTTLAGVTATDLVVTGNIVNGTGSASGGGLELVDTEFDMDGGHFNLNTAPFFGGGLNAIGGSNFAMRNAYVYENTGALWASGLYVDGYTAITLENNTVVDNSGSQFGGNGIVIANSDATVARNIIAYNGGTGTPHADGVTCSSSTVTFSCNVFYANVLGSVSGCPDPVGSDGNVLIDPEFCDYGAGDYSISPNSPAAAGQSGGCGTIGADAETCIGTGVSDGTPDRPKSFLVQQNTPNPFNPVTSISFAIPADGRVQVTVFDARGRRVATLLDREMGAGEHSVRWNGRDATGARVASGIYLYEVRSGQHRAVKKMGLIK